MYDHTVSVFCYVLYGIKEPFRNLFCGGNGLSNPCAVVELCGYLEESAYGKVHDEFSFDCRRFYSDRAALRYPAAYALSRMKFKGQTAFLGFVIVSQMFAPVVLLIGIYKVIMTLGLTDSILGLIFINAAFNQAFTIWPLRGTFIGISPEMEQAAKIDGCSRLQAMLRILLPVFAPGIVTTLIFVFINAWNEYTVALTLISTDTNKPLTVGINIFNGYNMIEWQYLFAASLFAIVPVVILFAIIEKNLVSGLASGGVKG